MTVRPGGGAYRRWVVRPPDLRCQLLAASLDISPVIAQILVTRGYADPAAAGRFLEASLQQLHPADLLPDAPVAARRLRAAVARGERIRVFGDYDVDGVAATALVCQVLRSQGASVDYYIPHRVEEGYGLNEAAVRQAAEEGIRLLVTVDCGVTAVRELQVASRLGLDVVVTDHHDPGSVLPDAIAVVNPKRRGSRYPFADLAGVGVAAKLMEAAFGRRQLLNNLDLVALGTVADVAPLVGENRILVRAGLERMRSSPRPGVAALCRRSGVRDMGEISVRTLAYVLAPRINAVGRLDHAGTAVDLLMCEDAGRAQHLAEALERSNRRRQRVQNEVLRAALAACRSQCREEDRVLVVAGEDWHPGVLGIVASCLCEEFGKPAVVLTREGGEARGSARSQEGFDLSEALSRCAHLLIDYGGHAQAAGLVLRWELLDDFRREINDYARQVEGGAPDGPWVADAVVETAVDDRLLEELERLGPFGPGNPQPLLCMPQTVVRSVDRVGRGGRHLKAWVEGPDGSRYPAIAFNVGRLADALARGNRVDLLFTPDRDVRGGRGRLILNIRDAVPARVPVPSGEGLPDWLRWVPDERVKVSLPPVPHRLVEEAAMLLRDGGGTVLCDNALEAVQLGWVVARREGAGLIPPSPIAASRYRRWYQRWFGERDGIPLLGVPPGMAGANGAVTVSSGEGQVLRLCAPGLAGKLQPPVLVARRERPRGEVSDGRGQEVMPYIAWLASVGSRMCVYVGCTERAVEVYRELAQRVPSLRRRLVLLGAAMPSSWLRDSLRRWETRDDCILITSSPPPVPVEAPVELVLLAPPCEWGELLELVSCADGRWPRVHLVCDGSEARRLEQAVASYLPDEGSLVTTYRVARACTRGPRRHFTWEQLLVRLPPSVKAREAWHHLRVMEEAGLLLREGNRFVWRHQGDEGKVSWASSPTYCRWMTLAAEVLRFSRWLAEVPVRELQERLYPGASGFLWFESLGGRDPYGAGEQIEGQDKRG